ncbi:hypothetical protein QBC35DRAFT_99125 [Podospora australis]|uniref:Uncharacterized protein n=1 Tax=Podospora australis TaxID=1536484 RepID=A0AAN7ANG6_9PEZI|nr:hypothetical protein QBC35DRAFT_99125 [Podospora australis]
MQGSEAVFCGDVSAGVLRGQLQSMPYAAIAAWRPRLAAGWQVLQTHCCVHYEVQDSLNPFHLARCLVTFAAAHSTMVACGCCRYPSFVHDMQNAACLDASTNWMFSVRTILPPGRLSHRRTEVAPHVVPLSRILSQFGRHVKGHDVLRRYTPSSLTLSPPGRKTVLSIGHVDHSTTFGMAAHPLPQTMPSQQRHWETSLLSRYILFYIIMSSPSPRAQWRLFVFPNYHRQLSVTLCPLFRFVFNLSGLTARAYKTLRSPPTTTYRFPSRLDQTIYSYTIH